MKLIIILFFIDVINVRSLMTKGNSNSYCLIVNEGG